MPSFMADPKLRLGRHRCLLAAGHKNDFTAQGDMGSQRSSKKRRARGRNRIKLVTACEGLLELGRLEHAFPCSGGLRKERKARTILAEYPDSQVPKDPQRGGTQKLTGAWAAFTSVTQLLL